MELAASVGARPWTGSSHALVDADWTIAVGLIVGYGAIAVHSNEGFRAGLASIACIFSDAPEGPKPEYSDLRRATAEAYGVPCITLEGAIAIGFLQEMGVERDAIQQLRAWIAAGRPLAPPPQRPPTSVPFGGRHNQGQLTLLTGREWQIARMLARGLTTVEIARSISLNLRAVDFHIYRLVEKTDSRNREQLVDWMKKHDR